MKFRYIMFVYLVGALLTFGYVHNRHECQFPEREKSCSAHKTFYALGPAYFWPLYWGVRLAIEVTKP